MSRLSRMLGDLILFWILLIWRILKEFLVCSSLIFSPKWIEISTGVGSDLSMAQALSLIDLVVMLSGISEPGPLASTAFFLLLKPSV
jgi:hypothetical protein